MKSKAPLALMEQILMVMVFALAAGLCLQVFVLGSQISHRCEAKDRAVLVVQNVAEVWKIHRGDARMCVQKLGGTYDVDGWQVGYDANWEETGTDEAEYLVYAVPVATEDLLLGSVEICAQTADGDHLFEVSVAWQEDGNE